MKDIVDNQVDDEQVKNHQMIEILKTNTEIKKFQKGEPFSAHEQTRYETPNNLWRDTLAIQSNKDNIFKDERDAFIKNFNDFLSSSNLDDDPDKLQEQVNSYIEQCKVYNENRNDKLKHLEAMETRKDNEDSDSDDEPFVTPQKTLLK